MKPFKNRYDREDLLEKVNKLIKESLKHLVFERSPSSEEVVEQHAKEMGKAIADDIDQKIFKKIVDKYVTPSGMLLSSNIARDFIQVQPMSSPKYIPFYLDYQYGKKCDCGAEKAKTPHVDWCQKY